MKRLLALVCAALLGYGAAAQAVRDIRDVDIRVEVEPDGSAWVTQIWNVEAGSSGTEFYLPVGNLGPMTIGSLSVSENGTEFVSLGDRWDVDQSRSWKTGKCGIVRKSNGVELCWGLGATGSHLWTVRFRLTGLVQAYDDADAFNFQFVNKGMDPAPQHARVTIVPAFNCPIWTPDHTRVWAFGFYGDINVVNGKVVAETSESMDYSSSLIALVKFEKGLFLPTVEKGGPFQDLLDRALDGSAYGEDDDLDGMSKMILGAFALSIIGLIALVIWMAVASALGYKWKKSLFGKRKITEWYRDVPLEGNLNAAQYLLTKGKRFGMSNNGQNIIGAFFLRWIMNGALKVQPDPKSSKRVNLQFMTITVSDDDVEEDLFQMARSAAGDNQLLEKGEFEKWSTKHYQKLTAWPDRSIARGRSWFNKKGYFVKSNVCTETGAREACHVIEFWNFLKDFTLTDQREAGEVHLWKEYLVYAQLFGIADKVAKQFKKLYPAEFSKLAQETGMDTTTLLYATSWTNHLSTKAFTGATARAGSVSGGGGHSSFGGGGGFSGGGHSGVR